MGSPNIMMTLDDTTERRREALAEQALPKLQALIARHGALAVGWAFLRAALSRRHHPPDGNALNDHIRRDIGLLPRAARTEQARRGWDF